MKKHLIYTIALFFLGFVSIQGQQISICTNSSGGGYAENASGSMSYTLGQLVYKTAEDPTGILTQGFQQPLCPPNSPPTAVAGGPYILLTFDDLALNGSGSSDPDGACGDAIASYSWDLNNDATFGDATGESPLVAWSTLDGLGISAPGTYTIKLEVTDGNGATDIADATLTITDSAVPTLGQWGLINLGLLFLCGGSIVIWRRQYPLVVASA